MAREEANALIIYYNYIFLFLWFSELSIKFHLEDIIGEFDYNGDNYSSEGLEQHRHPDFPIKYLRYLSWEENSCKLFKILDKMHFGEVLPIVNAFSVDIRESPNIWDFDRNRKKVLLINRGH